MNIYRSRIDLWLVAVFGGSFLLPIILMILWDGPMALTFAITIPMLGFIVWLYFATKYEVLEKEIVIHAGLYKVIVPRQSITSVTPSNNVMSSPAFSIDRLEITYGQNDKVLISPKNQAQFLESIGWAGK